MIEQSLTYSLSSIVEDGIGAANEIFVSRFGWSVRELRVLRLIRSNPGVTFTLLAERTKFERSLTSRTLKSLIQSGLVERKGSPSDARTYALHVTAKGETLCREADPLTAEFEALMLAPLSEKDRKAFVGMLDSVRDWVQHGYIREIRERHGEVLPKRGGRKASA